MRKGLRNEMRAANDYRSGSFDYQHISKSKSVMYSGSSRPLGLNEPYLRGNISSLPIIRPAHAKKIPAKEIKFLSFFDVFIKSVFTNG